MHPHDNGGKQRMKSGQSLLKAKVHSIEMFTYKSVLCNNSTAASALYVVLSCVGYNPFKGKFTAHWLNLTSLDKVPFEELRMCEGGKKCRTTV